MLSDLDCTNALRIELRLFPQSASHTHGVSVLLPGCDDNGFPCAFYDGKQLCLLRLGHVELVERLLKVIEKGLPLLGSDQQILISSMERPL